MNWNSPNFWCDGGCRGNHLPRGHKDRLAYGSISDGSETKRLEFPDLSSNNEAEFETLLHLLLALPTDPEKAPTIYMDSALVVNILTKGWNVKASNLRDVAETCKALLPHRAKLKWVSRETLVEKVGH